MVYLAELLVVMTDGLKIVRICARNVPRTRTQALRRRRVSRSRKAAAAPGAILLKHKNSSWNNLCMSGSGLIRKKVVATVCRLHFDTKHEQSDNKSSALRKNLEHPRLTRQCSD